MQSRTIPVVGGLLLIGGVIGLCIAVVVELTIGTDLEPLISFGLMNHRMLLVTAAGFFAVTGAILLIGSLVLRALGQQTQAIRDAVNAPDPCPAASLVSRVGRANDPVPLPTRPGVYRSGDKA